MNVGYTPGKFMNWWSYGQKQKKIQVFHGMLVAALDRTLGMDPSPAVRELIWCFSASGFPIGSFDKAKAILCKKHPYLLALLSSCAPVTTKRGLSH